MHVLDPANPYLAICLSLCVFSRNFLSWSIYNCRFFHGYERSLFWHLLHNSLYQPFFHNPLEFVLFCFFATLDKSLEENGIVCLITEHPFWQNPTRKIGGTWVNKNVKKLISVASRCNSHFCASFNSPFKLHIFKNTSGKDKLMGFVIPAFQGLNYDANVSLDDIVGYRWFNLIMAPCQNKYSN